MSNQTKRDHLTYTSMCKYKNEIDYVNKLISIYSIIFMDKDSQLRKFEKDILNYYIRFGYSTETKKRIQSELGKSSDNITQTNFHLRNKGFLVNSKSNMSKKKLNKDLQAFRDNFISGNKKILAIGFKRK